MDKSRGFYASIALSVGSLRAVGLHYGRHSTCFTQPEIWRLEPATHSIVKVPYPKVVACSIG